MGITCAVAWELPSKPPSKIIEHFRKKLNDGTLVHNRRNGATQQPLEYINSLPMKQETIENKNRWIYKQGLPSHIQKYQQLPPTTTVTFEHTHFLTNRSKSTLLPPTKSDYYNNDVQQDRMQEPITASKTVLYGRRNFDPIDAHRHRVGRIFENYFNLQARKQIYDKMHNPSKNWNSENWQPQNHIEKHWKEIEPRWSHYQRNRRARKYRKILNEIPKHRIYSVFAEQRRRRSSAGHYYSHNDDVTEKLQYIHSREHLQTRQKLYEKNEKLYNTRGQNGTSCVLRALCETERMSLNAQFNKTPQSFVMELLRSIFSLPKATLTNSNSIQDSLLHLDGRYVDAVLLAHDVTKSCFQPYHDCEFSIIT